jgi:hypothetical protein
VLGVPWLRSARQRLAWSVISCLLLSPVHFKTAARGGGVNGAAMVQWQTPSLKCENKDM